MAEKNFVLHSNSIALPAPMMAGSSDPVDARYIVKTKANLTAGASTWNTSGNYALIHIGMTVYVADEKTQYMYVGPEDAQNGVLLSETQKLENWRPTSTPNFNPDGIIKNVSVNGTAGTVSNGVANVTINPNTLTLGNDYDTTNLEASEPLTISGTDSVNKAFKKVNKIILDNEKVVAASLNDLNTRTKELSGKTVTELTSSNNTIGFTRTKKSDGTINYDLSVIGGGGGSTTNAKTYDFATTTDANHNVKFEKNESGNLTNVSANIDIYDCGEY